MRARIALLAGVAALGAALVPATPAGAATDSFELGGRPCKLIEVPQAAPFGVAPCPGVRPGAAIETDKGFCSLNFLFTGSDGNRYAGTAGHCILGDSALGGEDAGERSWGSGAGPEVLDANGDRIGEFAYAVLQEPRDFALIRLDSGVAASAAMCFFGGPTGTNSDQTTDPVVLQHYGNGAVVGTVLPARTSLALSAPAPDHVFANGLAAPGDSGGGVISADGRAVGVLVTVGLHADSIGADGIDAGLIGITRLAPQVARAEEVLGLDLTLQTAPLN